MVVVGWGRQMVSFVGVVCVGAGMGIGSLSLSLEQISVTNSFLFSFFLRSGVGFVGGLLLGRYSLLLGQPSLCFAFSFAWNWYIYLIIFFLTTFISFIVIVSNIPSYFSFFNLFILSLRC